MGRDTRSAFLRGAIHINRQELTVPMQLLESAGVIMDIDDSPLTFLETDQGTGELSVVCDCRQNSTGPELD
jgi:hypothetical protein